MLQEGYQTQRFVGDLYEGNNEQPNALTSNYEIYGNENRWLQSKRKP
jgi:hypothetical protein